MIVSSFNATKENTNMLIQIYSVLKLPQRNNMWLSKYDLKYTENSFA